MIAVLARVVGGTSVVSATSAEVRKAELLLAKVIGTPLGPRHILSFVNCNSFAMAA